MGNVNEKTLWVPLDKIRIDGGTQMRAVIDNETVGEYAEHLGDLPPSITFFDGSVDWLADGFHRYAAHRLKKAKQIQVSRRVGTQRDAILFSLGANAQHGLRRTNADKRKAVETVVGDPEWSKSSLRWIAETCAVSEAFVRKVREEREKVVTTTNAHNARSSLQRQSSSNVADDIDLTKQDGPTPAKKPAKPEQPKDDLGNEIKEEKTAIQFGRRDTPKGWLQTLIRIKSEMNAMIEAKDPLSTHVPVSNLIAALNSAYTFAKEFLPYAVCPFCAARNPTCTGCRGTGFLTKYRYDNIVPRELKEEPEV